MRFVANLRQETIDAFAAQDTQPAAFLLSSHRVTVSNLKAAAVIRALNIPLFADNGSKILIENTVEVFGDLAKNVRDMVNRLRRQLGHVPRGMDVPKGLRSAASDLAVKVVKHATDVSEAIDHQDLLVRCRCDHAFAPLARVLDTGLLGGASALYRASTNRC